MLVVFTTPHPPPRSNIVVSCCSYCCWNCCVAEPKSIDYIRHRSTIKVCMRVIWHAEAMRRKWKQKLQLRTSHPWGVVRQSTAKPCLRHLRSQEYVIQLSHGNHPFRALSLLLGNTLMVGGKIYFWKWRKKLFSKENCYNQCIVFASWKRERKHCSNFAGSCSC